MNKEKQKIVPALRFPEFENDGEWKTEILTDIATFAKGKGVSKKDIVSDGKIFCIRYGELYTDYNEVIDKVISKTNLPENELVLSKGNEVIIPSSGETRIDIARASCVILEGIALGGDLNIIKTEINGVFFSYYLNSAKKMAIAKMAQGVSVMHLYNSQLEKLDIEFPEPKEQQKIANCLSSLDTLITAATEKLDHLKDHKKGLLQQLFPAKGETQPQFRFPEFVGDGEWVTDSLGSLVEIKGRIGYRGYTKKDIVAKGKGAITLSPSNFDKNGKLNFEKTTYITWKKYDESPEIMLEEGQTVLVKTASVGKSAYVGNLPEKATINPQIVVLKPQKIEPEFLAYTIFHNYVQNQIKESIGAGAIPNMSQASIANFEILLPPGKDGKEQQKIANCLSSVDDLIAAQTIRIEALKEHKKGLLQQLFPNVKEYSYE